MPESSISGNLIPPPGEVRVITAAVQRVAGGDASLTGISWNADGHIALSIRGEGVRLVASPAELLALAGVIEAIAHELAGSQPRPELPPPGQAFAVPLVDCVLENVRQAAGEVQTGVTVSRPGALTMVGGGHGVRLTIRDRADVAALRGALDLIDAHLGRVASDAGAALSLLAGAETAGNG
jgi:hypothetical protein